MPGVTEEQIIAARRMTAIEFLRRYRPGELVKTDSGGSLNSGNTTASRSMKKPASGIGKAGTQAADPPSIISSR